MAQSLISSINYQKKIFEINGEEAHHLVRVLRKKVGDDLSLFDGESHRFFGKITAIDPSGPSLKGVLLRELPQTQPKMEVRLFQGIPRGSKFDYVIEKATELGVSRIAPFLSEKNLIKLDEEQKIARRKRWHNLAKAAAKQSNRSNIPVIHPVRELFDSVDSLQEGMTFVLTERGDGPIKKILLARKYHGGVVNVLVGPESGFSIKEEEKLKVMGGMPISLGNMTLRTETAGLAFISILNYEFGSI